MEGEISEKMVWGLYTSGFVVGIWVNCMSSP